MKNKILAVMLSAIFTFSFAHANKSEYEAERYNLDKITDGLEKFKGDLGYYPNSHCGLGCLKTNLHGDIKWKGPYVSSDVDFKDLNGRPVIYRVNKETFILYSVGENGVDDGGVADDIKPHLPGGEWNILKISEAILLLIASILIVILLRNKFRNKHD